MKKIIPLLFTFLITCHGTQAQELKRKSSDNKYGFVDASGKLIIPYKYSDTWFPSEGLIAVKQWGNWGFIDKADNTVIIFQYEDARSFSDGIAAVKQKGNWGYIDKTGKEVIPFKYEQGSLFREGLIAVMANGKWGFIDKTGKEVIPFKYESAAFFSEGLAAVMMNNKWGYIDNTGKEIIPYLYDDIEEFTNGSAEVKLNGATVKITKPGSATSATSSAPASFAKHIALAKPSGTLTDEEIVMKLLAAVHSKNKNSIMEAAAYFGISGFTISDKETDKTSKNYFIKSPQECICYISDEKILGGELPFRIFFYNNGEIELTWYIGVTIKDKHERLYRYLKSNAELVFAEKVQDFFNTKTTNKAIIRIFNGTTLTGGTNSFNGGSVSIYTYTALQK